MAARRAVLPAGAWCPPPISGIFGPAARRRGMMPVTITRTPLWEWVRGAAELWRCRVPIGETLAQARQRAGLTVAQVSGRTRIREAVIKGIEGGDYSPCGGDFYARANIRSIARAVGADSGPLIAEYDALHRAPGALPAVSLEELLASPVPAPQAAREPSAPAYRPRGRWLSWIVVLGLLVVVGFGVYSRFSGPRHAAAVPPAAGRHAVTHQQTAPSGRSPAPKLTHGAVTPAPVPKLTHTGAAPTPAPKLPHAAAGPAPATAAPAQTLSPAGAGAPGAGGGNAPPARDTTSGDHAAGPAHPLVHHRPPPQPLPRHGPAPGRALPGHGHGRRHHHRRHAPAKRHNIRPAGYA